jgi:citrate synthase
MASLKETLAAEIPALREKMRSLAKEHGDQVVAQITIGQIVGGMRGMPSLVCDTSSVPADKGLIIRGIPIKDLADVLPEEAFWLLVTGKLPSKEELAGLQSDLNARAKVPGYVWDVLQAMPKESHPMAMLDTAILCMQKESVFHARYQAGMSKNDYWDATLEDCLNIIARVPEIAAGIYRMRFDKGERLSPKPGLDWAAQYAHLLGLSDPNGDFTRLMRLYVVLHTDHESGNVSAHTTHCVGSALSDPYYSISAGLNGLAGPLHGLANQEVLHWILQTIDKFGGVPTDEQLHQFAWDTLNSGHVIPGYGHAVLRITDPRFDAFLAFGKKYCADSPVVQLVEKVFQIVPKILMEQGKAKDPWPNVDSASGSLLYHYGMTEFSYYTVLFAVSRILGMSAQLVLSRAWGEPIERPKSVTTEWLQSQVKSPAAVA